MRAHGTRARGEHLIPDSKDPTLRTVSKSAARAPLARQHFVSLKNSFAHIGEVSSASVDARECHARVRRAADVFPLGVGAVQGHGEVRGVRDRAVRAFGAA